MSSSPVAEPVEKAATPTVDFKMTKPAPDETPEELPSAQTKDSGSATSLSNTSSSTRNIDSNSDTETTSSGQPVDDAEDAEVAKESVKDTAKETASPAAPPPLPDEPLPEEQDDGWDPMWSDEHQAWYFYNRITQQTQWDNPRVPVDGASAVATSTAAGGYNPAIHGDYDPTAWYATGGVAAPEEEVAGIDEAAIAAAAAAAAAAIQNTDPSTFRGSKPDVEFGGGHRYTREAKTGRQLNAYFDVETNINDHDGRSLKAERSGKKPTKAELKAFKEKRRVKKEEKRRAWLRD